MVLGNNVEITRNSPGLLGLGHFRNSRVATSLWEPIYQNLFSVQLVAPEGLQDRTQERINVILEGVQSVGALNVSKGSGAVTQNYKIAQRSYAGAAPDGGSGLELLLLFALNLSYDTGTPENYTYKFLREWVDLVYDPLTGRQGLKKDYVAPSITVTVHDRAGTPYWQWIFYYCFPTTGAPQPNLAYNSTSLMEGTMTFRCDWWDECCL